MLNFKRKHILLLLVIVIFASLVLSSCAVKDRAADPGDWGYDCKVIYEALGGTINNRETRETYYMTNSYIFKPAGTTNMLIEPAKDGYVLAGWYRDKEDVLDDAGNVIDYAYKAEDRWDFDEDRVQEDMTLYARWVPQAKVDYVDVESGRVMFSKNITKDSGIQPLSSAVANLIDKEGYTFEGYFEDEGFTIPYDFTAYEHQDLNIENKDIYDILHGEFPEYIETFEYEEPSEEDLESDLDTSDLYINKLGYEIVDDEDVRNDIRQRKDEIYHNLIESYVENTSSKFVYLKYSEGNYAQISSLDDLKIGGRITFSGNDKLGNPVDGYNILNDIDFKDESVTMTDFFDGEIIGNGYTLKNISLNIKSRKIDEDKSKELALFKELDGAIIEDLTFENIDIKVDANTGIPVTIAGLALSAKNTSLDNVTFKGMNISTGKGDDGGADYVVSDLFVEDSGNNLNSVTGQDINIEASDSASIKRFLD